MAETSTETSVVCRGCGWIGPIGDCDRYTLKGVTLVVVCPMCESPIEEDDDDDVEFLDRLLAPKEVRR